MSAQTHAAHGEHDDGAVHVHVAPAKFYWGIFGALVFLTIVTVKVSYYDFGSANTIIAMLIATMKAGLVATFFMHLRHDKAFNTICFLSAFLFLGIFILLTTDDTTTRGRVDDSYGTKIFPPTGEVAPGGFPSAMVIPSSSAPHGGGHGEPPKHH